MSPESGAAKGQSPSVSVIVPIYNAIDYLAEGIRGLTAQTLSDIEIICIDDGSTDGTAALLDELAATDSRIVVVHQPNGGAGAARNAGLRIARGEYLSILDIDDSFDPYMLEIAFRAAKVDDLDIVVFRCDEYYPDQDVFKECAWTIKGQLLPDARPFAGVEVERDVFKVFVGWAWDKLFRADFVRSNGLLFQEIRTTNDMLFVFSAIVKAQRIGVLQEVLVHHRKASGSLSVTREKSWGCFYEALCALRQQLDDWGLYDRFERDFINYCVHASLWNVRTLAEPTKTLLKEKLASDWYDDLGVTAHDEDYFYNKGEYADYRRLMGDRQRRRQLTRFLKKIKKLLARN